MDRTTIVGIFTILVAFASPVIVAAANDPQFARWAILLTGVSSGLTGVGLILARDDKKSDQEAGARVPNPSKPGTFVDAADVPLIDFDADNTPKAGL